MRWKRAFLKCNLVALSSILVIFVFFASNGIETATEERSCTDNSHALAERRSRLDRICQKYSNPFRPEYAALFMQNTSAINDFGYFQFKQRFTMICSIQKVGSNSVHNFLRVLSEELMEDRQHESALLIGGTETKLGVFPVTSDCWPQCALEHTKVLLVRHPLERLLSAYLYIFRTEGKYFYDELSWEDFVSLIINNPAGNHKWTAMQTDVGSHWEPYWRVCQVCDPNLRPHFILKLETIREDLDLYLGDLGLSEYSNRFPRTNSRQGHSTSLRLVEFYSRLNRSTIEELHNAYKLDHEMFDYDPQPFYDLSADQFQK